jgi:cob(I)alamin adenosyltransferase
MSNKRKPEKVITKIRTGTGDSGTTYFRGTTDWPKSSIEIEYLGQLDTIQSFLVIDNRKSFHYIRKAQDLVFALGANFNSPANGKYQMQVSELTDELEGFIETIIEDCAPLSGFLRTIDQNKDLRQACTAVRHAEVLYYRTCENNPEPLITTDHRKALNVLSDFLFALAWKASAISGVDTDDRWGNTIKISDFKFLVPDQFQWKG